MSVLILSNIELSLLYVSFHTPPFIIYLSQETMQKFFKAIETISKREAGPAYPHKTRPITRRNGEPGILIKPFTQPQLETIRTMRKEKLESVFKKHLGKLKFDINEDRLGIGRTFTIVTDPGQGPYIVVSTAPAEIEFNFKRSSCSMSEEDRRKYFMFLWELLGEQL